MRAQLMVALVVGAAGFAFGGGGPQATPPQGWQERKPDLPFTAENRRYFTLTGKFLPPVPSDAANPPSLLIKCVPSKRTAGEGKFRVGVVLVGVPVEIHMVEVTERKGGLSYYPEVSVSYRLDEGKARTDEWPPGPDKSSVEFEKADFKRMLGAHSVLVTLPDKPDHELRMQFDMPDPAAGAPVTSAAVARACGFPELPK